MNRIDPLLASARACYSNDDPGHDFGHILRVVETARRLGEVSGANVELLLAAAALHDLVNMPKDSSQRLQASSLAAAAADPLLRKHGFSEKDIGRIRLVIEEHSYSAKKPPSSLESAILQDADRLDALGAIGIMRTTTCGCRLGASYYHLDEPFPSTRPLDDKHHTIDHFYAKLLRLADEMHTAAAREEAKRRTRFMHAFLDQLSAEIGAPVAQKPRAAG